MLIQNWPNSREPFFGLNIELHTSVKRQNIFYFDTFRDPWEQNFDFLCFHIFTAYLHPEPVYKIFQNVESKILLPRSYSPNKITYSLLVIPIPEVNVEGEKGIAMISKISSTATPKSWNISQTEHFTWISKINIRHRSIYKFNYWIQTKYCIVESNSLGDGYYEFPNKKYEYFWSATVAKITLVRLQSSHKICIWAQNVLPIMYPIYY